MSKDAKRKRSALTGRTSSSGQSVRHDDALPKNSPGVSDAISYVVVLVHGTWGRTSPFIEPAGSLQTTLKERLPGAMFSVFTWSGRNRARDRLEAAADLGRHIRQLHERHPDSRLVVVAHSHGGNVALYALKDPDVDIIVSGVVCFSTPFINVAKRTIMRDDVYTIAIPLVLGAPLMALLAAGAYWLYEFWFY